MYGRHCTIRAFLKLLGVSEEAADADACEMEHIISPETYSAIQRYIDKNDKG